MLSSLVTTLAFAPNPNMTATCDQPWYNCLAGDTCCPDIHGTPFSCVPWGDDGHLCRDTAHATCAKSQEWCHGVASKLAPYPCCNSAETCKKVDQYNFKCTSTITSPESCTHTPWEPCNTGDTCCDDAKGNHFTCVPWGDNQHMCRDTAHATCAKSQEWCHGVASKLAPYPCCNSAETCSQVDQYNFECK